MVDTSLEKQTESQLVVEIYKKFVTLKNRYEELIGKECEKS